MVAVGEQWPQSPTGELVRETRRALGLTQKQAGEMLYKKGRTWQRYEAGVRKLDPALWEYFLLKTRKLSQLQRDIGDCD